ncbi:MFS transporter [Patescibacteria group bacterium]|nr:MFS transporter [Patescibacteria group bacterium]
MVHKNIRLLSVFNFLIGFTFFAPLAIIYFTKVSGSYTLGTSIFGIVMLSAAFFEIPTGIISDKVGRRHTIILGSWARVLAFIFYAIGQAYWILLIGAIFEGISRSFYSGNNDALLYDTLADENNTSKYHEYLGKTSSMEFIALAISSVIGGFVAIFSFPIVMWSTVVSQFALLIISYGFIDPKTKSANATNIFQHLKEAISIFRTNEKLRLLNIATILDNGFSELAYQFRGAFFITVWPLWAIGMASVISNITASIGFNISGKIINKVKAEAVAFYRSVLDRIINIFSLIFPNIVSPALMSSTSLLYGLGTVAENELRQREYSDEQRATMDSFVSLGRSISASIMTVVLGGVADLYGPRNALLMMTLLAFSVTFLYWKILREHLIKAR